MPPFIALAAQQDSGRTGCRRGSRSRRSARLDQRFVEHPLRRPAAGQEEVRSLADLVGPCRHRGRWCICSTSSSSGSFERSRSARRRHSVSTMRNRAVCWNGFQIGEASGRSPVSRVQHRTRLHGPRAARRRPDRGHRGRRSGAAAEVDRGPAAGVARGESVSSRSPARPDGDGPADRELAAAVRPTRSLIALARPISSSSRPGFGEAVGLSIPDGFTVHYVDQGTDACGGRSRLDRDAAPDARGLGRPRVPGAPPSGRGRRVPGRASRAVHGTHGDRAEPLRERIPRSSWTAGTGRATRLADGISSIAATIADEDGDVVAAVHIHGRATASRRRATSASGRASWRRHADCPPARVWADRRRC